MAFEILNIRINSLTNLNSVQLLFLDFVWDLLFSKINLNSLRQKCLNVLT